MNNYFNPFQNYTGQSPYNVLPQTTNNAQGIKEIPNPPTAQPSSPLQGILGQVLTGKMVNIQALIQQNPGLVGIFQNLQKSNPSGIFMDVAKQNGVADETAKKLWSDFDLRMSEIFKNYLK